MNDQMIVHKTRKLDETDFASAETLLTNENFSIAQKCANPTVDCWKTKASGKDKITYKKLDGSIISVDNDVRHNSPAVILKNGAIINYTDTSNADLTTDGTTIIGNFYIDVNGNEPPNIGGRDLFSIYVTREGTISNGFQLDNLSTAEYTAGCKQGWTSYCFSLLVKNGWKMDY